MRGESGKGDFPFPIFYLFLIVFAFLYLPWFLISVVMAVLGLAVPHRRDPLGIHEAESTLTVCRVLYDQGILPKEDFELEMQQVRESHSRQIFLGYIFVATPFIFCLNRSRVLGRLFYPVLRLWLGVQKDKIFNRSSSSFLEHKFIEFCVFFAERVGLLVDWISSLKIGRRKEL